MSLLRNLLVEVGLSERRKDGRVPARGLEASYWTGLEQKRAKIKDISATGIYLLTEDKWLPGTAVELTLQKRSLLEKDSRPRVRLRARCVRLGDDGVGLTFVEEPARAADWSKSMAVAAEVFTDSHPVRLFRATKALAFLLRISPSAETQVLQFISEIRGGRAERAIETVLKAEELLSSRESGLKSEISPSLVLRILEYGSKAFEEQVQQCWAGLFASSFRDETQDDTVGRCIVLLSKLDRDHISVLIAACTKAIRTGWQPGFVFPFALFCTADEIRNIIGIHNPVAVERSLNHLSQLGLMERTVRPLGCAQLEQVNITPTSLGLMLYARCCGNNELPEALECSSLEMAS